MMVTPFPLRRCLHQAVILILAIIATLSTTATGSWFLSTAPQDEERLGRLVTVPASAGCDAHAYKTYLFSENPLVVYVEDFLTVEEAAELVRLSEENFTPSPLFSDDGRRTAIDPSYRSSHTATLSRSSSPLITCLESRAKSFPYYSTNPTSSSSSSSSSNGGQGQGMIKPLVVQRYNIANQYKDHYDWFPEGPYIEGNIESTFFVYIQANCTGGGTNFPRLLGGPPSSSPSSSSSLVAPAPGPGKSSSLSGDESDGSEEATGEEGAEKQADWCRFVDCDQPFEAGTTFKPVLGNAVFWVNLDGEGKGIKETLHAGLPVTRGTKMGMNIWTWVKNRR